MEILTLLMRARAAGLEVRREGEALVIRGPRSAEEIARAMLAAKRDVLLALEVERTLGLQGPWREDGLAECRRREVKAAKAIRRFAAARWDEAGTWSVAMLSGFFVRDLLAGMESALGRCDCWGSIRDRLHRQTGPTAIARLWTVFDALPPDMQARVIELGDRSQSPPECLVRGGHA